MDVVTDTLPLPPVHTVLDNRVLVMKNALRSRSVTIITDSQLTARLLKKELLRAGALVSVYTNGLEGLAAVREYTPDLVFLDTLTPLLNGREMLQILQSEGRTDSLPVLVLAESAETTTIEQLMEIGARDYVLKDTFEPGEVVQKTLQYLDETDTGSDTDGASDLQASVDISSQTQPATNVDRSAPRVYVIEDDPLLRNLLSVKFTRSNIRFVFNSDGSEALTKLRDFNPDVIILDLMLPGRSGFDILSDLRASDDLASLPVIVLSNRSSEEDLERAKKLGAAHFFVKALTDLNDVVASINTLSGKQRT